MSKVKVVCTGCGIWIMTEDDRASIRCPKCGVEITIKPVINVSQPTQTPVVASGAELESKLAYAEGLLTAECYDRAEKAFRNAAVLFPDDYRCHWGIVRSGTKNFTDYNGSDYAVDYANAIRNADEIPLLSMKENYSKYLDERRKSEYERKVGGKLAVFGDEPADTTAVSVVETPVVDLYEISSKQKEQEQPSVPVPAPAPAPAPVPEQPAVDPNVSFLIREQLNQRLTQHSDACKSAVKDLDAQLAELEDYREKRKGFVSYQVKSTPPVVEIVWFGIFAFLTLIFFVLLLLNKPAWLMWPLIIIFGLFTLFCLYNLLSELSFKKKVTQRRVQDNGEFERVSNTYKARIDALRTQIDYHKEQMAAVKKQLEETK